MREAVDEAGPDLVVAGAGGGLIAALRAAQRGCSVLVIDANEHFSRGNNTSMSTAMIPGAGTRFQRANEIDDSADGFVTDISTRPTVKPTSDWQRRSRTSADASSNGWPMTWSCRYPW